MQMPIRWKYIFARTMVAGLFLVVSVLQLFSFPGQLHFSRKEGDISLTIQIFLTIFLGSWMFAVQFGLISLWKLLNYMQSGNFFTASSFQWMVRLVNALKYAACIPLGLILIIAPQADDPGIMVVLMTLLLFSMSLAVLASLLRDQIKTKLTDSFG